MLAPPPSFLPAMVITLLLLYCYSGNSSGSDYKRQHQRAAAKLGLTVPNLPRSRVSSEQKEDSNSSVIGPLTRSSKTSQENSHNLTPGARPDLLENAIILSDYHVFKKYNCNFW